MNNKKLEKEKINQIKENLINSEKKIFHLSNFKNKCPKCRLKRAPKDLLEKNKDLYKKFTRDKLGLAGITTNLWEPNTTLKVGFDFTYYCVPSNKKEEFINQVLNIAGEWCENGSIVLEYSSNKSNCDILIGFKPYRGTWSYLGTDSLVIIGKGKNSMNIDTSWVGTMWDLEEKTSNFSRIYMKHAIKHEFGHALGFIHEHQRSDRPFQWDIDWMKANFDQLGLPTWQSVKSNYIIKEDVNYLTHGPYDFKSIMNYDWVADATKEKIASNLEDILNISKKDKNQMAILYPF
jgi:hypothetical protein